MCRQQGVGLTELEARRGEPLTDNMVRVKPISCFYETEISGSHVANLLAQVPGTRLRVH
jgi:hypothetical protein